MIERSYHRATSRSWMMNGYMTPWVCNLGEQWCKLPAHVKLHAIQTSPTHELNGLNTTMDNLVDGWLDGWMDDWMDR